MNFPIYSRFIGGRNIQNAIKKMQCKAFIPIYDMAKEGNKKIIDVERDTERIISDMKVIRQTVHSPVFFAIKGSTFGINHLPLADTYKMVREVVKQAQHLNIKVLFDAEQSWHTKSEDTIIEKLLDENMDVFKTYQMYRKDSLDRISTDISNGKVTQFKIVRGAYIEQEKLQNTNIIYDTKMEVDQAYDKAVSTLIKYSYTSKQTKDINVMLATHNMHSIVKANKLLQPKQFVKIYFAQLMGMDNFKEFQIVNQSVYVPYGNFTETLPYLLRRLYENRKWIIFDKFVVTGNH